MALIFLDKSKCPICNQLLKDGEEIWALPPISDNTNSLFHCFDAGLHKSCFKNWDKKDEAEAIIRKEIPNYKFDDL